MKNEKKEKRGRKKNNQLATKVLDVMKALQANGVEETNSTAIRDKLGLNKETGRDAVRRIMRGLAKDGKVVISEKAVSEKRKRYVYTLAG